MAKRVQLRRGTTAEHNTFTGAVGELTYDTTNKTLRVHDGATVGGKVINGTRIVTTPIDANLENTTGVRIINGTGSINLPFDVLGALNVYSNENFAIGALRVYQTFQPDVFSDLFFRKWDGASWSAWERAVKFSEKNTEAFGVGQTVQDVTASRALSTTYTNSTGKPILISVTVAGANDFGTTTLTVSGVAAASVSNSSQYGQTKNICYVIPPSSTYSVVGSPISLWTELR